MSDGPRNRNRRDDQKANVYLISTHPVPGYLSLVLRKRSGLYVWECLLPLCPLHVSALLQRVNIKGSDGVLGSTPEGKDFQFVNSVFLPRDCPSNMRA